MLWMLLAAGTPTYLACTLQESGKDVTVDVIVNEREQQAVIVQSTGRSVKRPTLISPTAIRIADEESVWTIDRVGLTFARRVVIGEREWNDRGKCKVVPVPPKRAF